MKPSITRLENSVQYFLHCVFIMVTEGEYDLVVIHNDQVQTDGRYGTLRGAKIAFSQLYCQQMCSEEVKPNWTQIYHPEGEWFEEKMKQLELYRATVKKEYEFSEASTV